SLTDLGIQVDLQVMEWAPFLDASDAGDFDLCLVGWNQGGPDPSLFLDALVKTGGRANDARNSDPEIDGWLEAAVYTANLEERQMYYRKVLEKVQDLAWYVPLYNENKLAGLRT